MTATFLHIAGVLGNAGFGIACLSLARRVWKAKNAHFVPPDTTALFLLGNIGFYTYLLGTYGFDPFYTFLGVIETGSWLMIAMFKLRDHEFLPDFGFATGGVIKHTTESYLCSLPRGHRGPCNGICWDGCRAPMPHPDDYGAFDPAEN